MSAATMFWRCLATVCLLVAAAPSISAQTFQGTVHDAETAAPVPGVLITIRDDTHRIVARVLSDAAGRFHTRLDTANVTVTAEHIGYAPRQLTVQLPHAGPLAIKLTPAPVALKEVVAETRQRCRKSNEKETARVWYFARTALGSTAAESKQRYRLRRFSQDFDLSENPVSDERMDFTVASIKHGFQAAATDTLLKHGFVQRSRKEGLTFYGPDADLLLSDEFVDTHCFQVTREGAAPGHIGLAFWPNNRQSQSDIQGKLWLDENTGALRFVDYVFTDARGPIDAKYAGGHVEFSRLEDGSWVVQRWTIRAPRYRAIPGRGARSSMAGFVRSGGELLGRELPGNASEASAPVSGVVFDSLSKRPVRGARVYLSGTALSAITDSSGKFVIDAAPLGNHYIDFHHARLDSIPPTVRARRITVERDVPLTVTLFVPSEDAIVKRHCSDRQLNEMAQALEAHPGRLGVFTGTLKINGSVDPAARVRVKWNLGQLPRALRNRPDGAWAEPDSQGAFVICGLPAGVDLRLFVEDGGKTLVHEFVRGESRRVLHRDFRVNP